MKRFFSLAVLASAFLVFAASASAADVTATVAKITGKAQLQKGADWIALKVGQVIPAGATVSTGFRSELLLKIGPSTVTVKALSRLTVQDLVQTGSDLKTDLRLTVGKIDATVNKDDVVKSNTFKVSSPVATASVRGTSFIFDGVTIEVTRGLVAFADQFGQEVSVPDGEKAEASETGGDMTTNEDFIAEESTTQADAGSDYGAEAWSEQEWTDFFESIDFEELLAFLEDYDWESELPNTRVFLNGIGP